MSQGKEKEGTKAKVEPIPICPHCKAPLEKLECSKRPFAKRLGLGYPSTAWVIACPTCHAALSIHAFL
jgi:hypothetical protein